MRKSKGSSKRKGAVITGNDGNGDVLTATTDASSSPSLLGSICRFPSTLSPADPKLLLLITVAICMLVLVRTVNNANNTSPARQSSKAKLRGGDKSSPDSEESASSKPNVLIDFFRAVKEKALQSSGKNPSTNEEEKKQSDVGRKENNEPPGQTQSKSSSANRGSFGSRYERMLPRQSDHDASTDDEDDNEDWEDGDDDGETQRSTTSAPPFWSRDDRLLKRKVMEEARQRCLHRYLNDGEVLRLDNDVSSSFSAFSAPLTPSSSSSPSPFKFPPAMSTRVFGLGAEGSMTSGASSSSSSIRAQSGQWVRFWVASVDSRGTLLCNGGASERFTREQFTIEQRRYGEIKKKKQNAPLDSSQGEPFVLLPPLEDTYEIVMEAVPMDTVANFFVAAQMPDGFGFADVAAEEGGSAAVGSHQHAGEAAAQLEVLNPMKPSTFRMFSVPSPSSSSSSSSQQLLTRQNTLNIVSNPLAGYSAYFGNENGLMGALLEKGTASAAPLSGDAADAAARTSLSAALEKHAIVNDGPFASSAAAFNSRSPSTASSPSPNQQTQTLLSRQQTQRGVFSQTAPHITATKVPISRAFYIGYGITEVQAFVKFAGTYDVCVAVTTTSASNGLRVPLQKKGGIALRLPFIPPSVSATATDVTAFETGLHAHQIHFQNGKQINGTEEEQGGVSDGARAPFRYSPLRLNKGVITREYRAQIEAFSALLKEKGSGVDEGGTKGILDNSFQTALVKVPPPSEAEAVSSASSPVWFGQQHQEIIFKNNIFRCVSGTFTPPPPRPPSHPANVRASSKKGDETASADGIQKILCTAPLSAFESAEAYKNRFRSGQWVRLKNFECDINEHCVVASYTGSGVDGGGGITNDKTRGLDGLPKGFSIAPSQSVKALLDTDGWVWATDACVMVFFHQRGIVERLFSRTAGGSPAGVATMLGLSPSLSDVGGTTGNHRGDVGDIFHRAWTVGFGSSVIKQPLSNFLEYRLGTPAMTSPFPIFMEELPKVAGRKKMPGFFSYREYANVISNASRRVPLPHEVELIKKREEEQRKAREGNNGGISTAAAAAAVDDALAKDASYQWVVQMSWAGCPSIVAPPGACHANGQIGMGNWRKVRSQAEWRLNGLLNLYSGEVSSNSGNGGNGRRKTKGEAIKALLSSLTAAGSGDRPLPEGSRGGTEEHKLTHEDIKGIVAELWTTLFPLMPNHFILDFSIWRFPFEDDVYLTQIGAFLEKIDALHKEASELVTNLWRTIGGGASPPPIDFRRPPPLLKTNNDSLSLVRDGGGAVSNLHALLLPKLPQQPLLVWHTRPMSLLVDGNKAAGEHSRPTGLQLEAHSDWSIQDALSGDRVRQEQKKRGKKKQQATAGKGGNEDSTTTSLLWEDHCLSDETRQQLKRFAHDNPFFILLPRYEMTTPFHVGNRYGHFGVHYGSSLGMCLTGGARPGYEMRVCLRKPWVDTMVAEMWINAIASHGASFAAI